MKLGERKGNPVVQTSVVDTIQSGLPPPSIGSEEVQMTKALSAGEASVSIRIRGYVCQWEER